MAVVPGVPAGPGNWPKELKETSKARKHPVIRENAIIFV